VGKEKEQEGRRKERERNHDIIIINFDEGTKVAKLKTD
jgi:hypothetical protein